MSTIFLIVGIVCLIAAFLSSQYESYREGIYHENRRIKDSILNAEKSVSFDTLAQRSLRKHFKAENKLKTWKKETLNSK